MLAKKYCLNQSLFDHEKFFQRLFGVTQLVMQFTHVSRHPGAYRRKVNKCFLDKMVLIM